MKHRKLRIAWSVAWFLASAVMMAICLYRQYLFEHSSFDPGPALLHPSYSDYREYARWSFFIAGLAFLTIPLPRHFTIRTMLIDTMLVAIALMLFVCAWKWI